MFNKDCEACFSSESLLESMMAVKQQLIHSVEELADLISEPLPPHQQATVEALLTILVHCRDILSHLIQHRISSSHDFEWTRLVLPLIKSWQLVLISLELLTVASCPLHILSNIRA